MIHFSPAQSAGAFLPPGHSFPPHAQSAHMQTQNMHMQSLYAAPQQFDINQLQSPTAQMQQQQQQQQQQQAQQQHLQLQMQWQHLQQQQAQLQQQQQQIMAAQTTGQGQQMQQTQQQQLLQQQTAPSSVTPLTSQQLASSVQQLPLASQPQSQPGALKADQLSYYPSAQTLSYSQFSFSPSAPGLYTSLNGSGAPIHPYYPFAQNGGMQTQQQTVGLPPVKLMSLTSPTNAGAMSAAATPLISSLSSTPATTSTGMTTLISMAPAPLSPSNGAPNALVQSDHKRKHSGSSHDSASPTPADSQCDQQSSAVTRALPKAKTTDASDVHKSSVQHRRPSYTSASPPVINVTQQQQQQQLSQAPHASQLTSPPTSSSGTAIPPHIGNHAQLRRYKHKEVEVRRRRKISTLFAELASLLECGPTDKASLLSIATKYIRRAKAKGVRPQSVEEGEEEDSDATDEGAATPAASAPATSTGAAAASRPRSSSISQTQPLPHRPLDVATSSSLRLPAASLSGAPAALVSLAASPSRPSSAPSSASSSVAQSPLPLQAGAVTTATNAAAAQVKIETTSKQSSER